MRGYSPSSWTSKQQAPTGVRKLSGTINCCHGGDLIERSSPPERATSWRGPVVSSIRNSPSASQPSAPPTRSRCSTPSRPGTTGRSITADGNQRTPWSASTSSSSDIRLCASRSHPTSASSVASTTTGCPTSTTTIRCRVRGTTCVDSSRRGPGCRRDRKKSHQLGR